ncbi:MAG: hypothetical protein ACKO5A_05275 [Actinomycetota bacterium]
MARVVLVSPHFDDIPLSLGQSLTDGFLSAHDVTVVVVFSRTNWTQWFHPSRATWRIWAVSRLRRMEEAVASRRFGYRVRTLGVSEWMLRTGRDDLEGLLDPSADPSSDPTVGVVRSLLEPVLDRADAVALCAAVGHHVDHQVIRQVGIELLGTSSLPVAFYEDRPYAALVPPADLVAAGEWIAERTEREVGIASVSGPISSALALRLRRTYPSQIDEVFTAALAADVAANATERVWVPRGSEAFWPSPGAAR